MDADEEKNSQYGSVRDDGSNIDEEYNAFQPHKKYASDEKDINKKDWVVKIVNGNLS